CFRGDVEKQTALENLDLILLCIDEIIDGGKWRSSSGH
ncbi:unnamed protein product, partial [Urochloa humidicola]